MRYVIDCSTAFKWFVSEAHRAKAIVLRNDFDNGSCELLAPDIFPTEITTVPLKVE
jgi:hypothetical protein